VHNRVCLAPDELHKPHSRAYLLEGFEKLRSVKRVNVLPFSTNTALTGPRLVAFSSSLGIDLESVICTSSEVCSSWVGYKLVNLQNEQTEANLIQS